MKSNPTIKLLGLLVGASMVLGACSSSSDSTSANGTDAAASDAVASDAAAESTPPAGGAEITIGIIAPTTGFAAADGLAALNSAKLAVSQINDAGGVKGQKIKLVNYDDGAAPDQATILAGKIINEDHAVAAISATYSGATKAAAAVFQQAKIPMVAAYAVAPAITATGDQIFRVGTLASVEGRIGAKLVTDNLKAKKIAVLVVDNDFGVSLADGFKKGLTGTEGKVVLEEKYAIGETEFRPLIEKIKAAAPDAVYATGYYSEAASLIKQMAEAGVKIPVVGQEGYDSPKFIELAGDAAEGTIITTDLNRDSTNPATQKFLADYKAKYNEDADMVGASAYDSVKLIAYAISQGGGTTSAQITTGLKGMTNFAEAASGPFLRFTAEREMVRNVGSQIVKSGKFTNYVEFTDEALIAADK